MGVGVLCTVGMVFDCDCSQVLACGSVLVHVSPGDHGEQGRKGSSGSAFGAALTGHCEDLGDARRLLRSHLLDPCHKHEIVQSGGNGGDSVEKCGTAGGARGFNSGTGNSGDAHCSGNERRQMALADEGRAGEIS
jgi:hypothetical protein